MAGFRFWSCQIVGVNHLYVHFPFCISKCNYCSFYSEPFSDELYQSYKTALETEISYYAEQYDIRNLKTLYIGGGTPGIQPAFFPWLESLLKKNNVVIETIAEYTVECNPIQINEEWLEQLQKSHCTRISLGVQSFSKKALEAAGRTRQDYQTVYKALTLLQVSSYSVSLDFINGLPFSDPQYDIKRIKNFLDEFQVIKHVSCYDLFIEKGSGFDREGVQGLDDKSCAEYERLLFLMLKGQGFKRYEVANFCKDHAVSLHNKAYWHYHNYLGAGPAAHSTVAGLRIENVPSLTAYCTKDRTVYKKEYRLSTLEQVEECLLMGFRLTEGIDTDLFEKKFHISLLKLCKNTINSYLKQHKIVFYHNEGRKNIAVTEEGLDMLNTILCDLFSELEDNRFLLMPGK